MAKHPLALLFALSVLARPATAAETASAELVWERAAGAESCGDREQIAGAVEQRWKRRVFVADRADFVVEGHVRRGASGEWAASLLLRSSDGTNLGQRELVTRAPTCAELDDAVVLALGIMLDLNRQTAEDVSHSEKPPPADLATPPANTEPLRVVPFVDAAASAGTLPGVAFGVRAGFGVLLPKAMRAQLSSSLYPAEDASSARPGARLSSWAVELAFFPFALPGGRLRADFGAGVRLTGFHGRGVGLYQVADANEAAASLGPRVALSFRIAGPLALDLGLGADAAFSRYRFVYRDSNEKVVSVYETAPIFGEIDAGLALIL